MKRLLTEVKVFLATLLGALLLKLLFATVRHKVVAPPGRAKDVRDSTPVIITFWHSQLLAMVHCAEELFFRQKRRSIHVLVSRHGDGRIIGNVVRFFRLKAVHGSSSRGGVKALLTLVEKLRAGDHVAITPDGPKGPALYLKEGALKVAELSGQRILPVGVALNRFWRFRSWDKMIMPKPFSTIHLHMGEAISVPTGLSQEEFEKFRLAVQDELNALTDRAAADV